MSHHPILIGLCGAAGSGKDTAAAHLQDAHQFARCAFAEPLRAMLEALLAECGLDHAWLFEPQLKEQPIPHLGHSYRALAQTLGTEWGRTLLGDDFWLRAAGLACGMPHVNPALNAPIHDAIVFTDVRFPNEAGWLRARGGVLVRVQRPGAAPVRRHVSEQLVDDLAADHTVHNSSGLGHLHEQLDALVLKLMTTHWPARRLL